MAYAERTEVTIDRTQAEIRKLIMAKGGTNYFTGEEPDRVHVAFRLSDRNIRFTLPLPKQAGTEKQWNQTCRSRWRGLFLCIKAKFESVDSKIETFEEAFLAHVQMPDGYTVGETIKPQLALAYKDNISVPLLPAPKGGA